MKVGVTGHQSREGADWSWVATSMRYFLHSRTSNLIGLTSLAAGADQMFAEEVLELGGQIWAVLPGGENEYRTQFDIEGQMRFDQLLKEATKVSAVSGTGEASFYNAGVFVVDNSDILLAVWDRRPALGHGGTADIVEYAQEVQRPIVILDPIAREVF